MSTADPSTQTQHTTELDAAPSKPRNDHHRIGVIDLGTNTFHLMIIDIIDTHRHIIQEKFKIPVKLGEGGITKNFISEAPFERGIEALKQYRKILDGHEVEDVYAFATSAIRGASNGPEFVDTALRETGIEIKVINGNEEAALIYQGVKSGVNIPTNGDSLIVDIGGGSVEFIVAEPAMAKLFRSTQLGAARLIEQVDPDDPITGDQIAQTEALIHQGMDGLLEELRQFDIQTIIGSSGSFETVGALVAAEDASKFTRSNPNNFVFPAERIQDIHRELISKSRDERLRMKGMEAMRVDMIVMGSILINLLVEELKPKEILISTFAMKEGILKRHLKSTRKSIRLTEDEQREAREKVIRALAKKFDAPLDHCEQVSALAKQILEQMQHPKPLPEGSEELIHYGALLYPIGLFVSRSGYHKHGQYIINNSNLRGFSSEESLMISNLVRYHRKSLPNKEHMHFNVLSSSQKEQLEKMAGILRLAIALDRATNGAVQGVQLNSDESKPSEIELIVHGDDDLSLEVDSVSKHRELFERAFGVQLEVRLA